MASTRTGHSWAGTVSSTCRARISAGILEAFRPTRPTSVAKASVSSTGMVEVVVVAVMTRPRTVHAQGMANCPAIMPHHGTGKEVSAAALSSVF